MYTCTVYRKQCMHLKKHYCLIIINKSLSYFKKITQWYFLKNYGRRITTKIQFCIPDNILLWYRKINMREIHYVNKNSYCENKWNTTSEAYLIQKHRKQLSFSFCRKNMTRYKESCFPPKLNAVFTLWFYFWDVLGYLLF